MPDAKPKLDNEPNDLEKKVDSMMAPDAPDVPESTKTEPKMPAFAVSGVPEVPKELSKGLDAFSEDAPDITSEDEATKPAVEEVNVDDVVQKADPKTQNSIDDPSTDEAVTEIVREEADTLLQVDDEESQAKQESETEVPKNTWWRNKKLIYTTVFGVLVFVFALLAWPTSRYEIMNTAGIRSKASIIITDDSTKLPLENVAVKIGDVAVKTDEKGVAAFDVLKLGKQSLVIERVAFAEIKKDIVIGWGSNPLGEVELHATGARYEIKVTDFASKKTLQAEASSEDSSAVADNKGVIKLVIDDVNKQTVEINVQAEGYRTEKITVAADKKAATEVVMVPRVPIVYVSKQSGKYDVYKVDADGQNKKLLLAGTGRESQDIKVALSPNGDAATVVSTRGTKRDAAGNLLQTVTLINTETAQSKTLDDANSVTLVDWVDKRLLYVATYLTGAKNEQEQRLISYNTDESARNALAASTYFSSVVSVGGYVYFAGINDDPSQPTAYQKIRVDGSGKQSILQARVLSAVRTNYDHLGLETADGWYAYKIGNDEATKANAPDSYVSKQYAVSPKGTQSVWLDNRDGKGTIVLRNQSTDKESVLVAAGGLTGPLRWLNETTVVYRVSNLNETADYVKSIAGGEPRKITNVTNATGLNIHF